MDHDVVLLVSGASATFLVSVILPSYSFHLACVSCHFRCIILQFVFVSLHFCFIFLQCAFVIPRVVSSSFHAQVHIFACSVFAFCIHVLLFILISFLKFWKRLYCTTFRTYDIIRRKCATKTAE